MDITITVRGLEELGTGLSALAAALPEALRQFAALEHQSRTDAHAASVVTPESPAQPTHTPERPVSVSYTHLDRLIERVAVSREKQITVHFRFQSEFEHGEEVLNLSLIHI